MLNADWYHYLSFVAWLWEWIQFAFHELCTSFCFWVHYSGWLGWEFSFTKRFIAQGADRHSFWVMMNQQANKKLWVQAHQNLQHEQSKLIAWPKTQCMQQLEMFWDISYTRWPDAGYGDVGHLTIFSAGSLLKQLGNLTRGSLKQLRMCGGTEAIVPVILRFCLQTCSPAQT